MNPKISIIIPVYNAAMYLPRLVESINLQTFKDFEVLFVNDGSSDSSYDLLNDLTKGNENYHVINQDNQGAPAARNKGIDLAKGDYLFFSDSDDELMPNCLELLYQHTTSDDVDLVIGGYEEVNAKRQHVKALDVYKTARYLENQPYNMNNLFFMPPNLFFKLIKRQLVVENHLRFCDVKIGQDLYFYFLLLPYVKKIKFEKQSVYKYYVNDGSISNSYDNRILNIIVTIDNIINYYVQNGFLEKYESELQYVLNGHLITQLFKTPYIENDKLKREITTSLIDKMNFQRVYSNKYYKEKPIYFAVLFCFKHQILFSNPITQYFLKKILPVYKKRVM